MKPKMASRDTFGDLSPAYLEFLFEIGAGLASPTAFASVR